MSFAIITYNNYSQENVVNKRKSQIQSTSCDFYGDFEIDGGDVILIDQTSQNCNYCYIEKYSRYYFASPEILHDGRLILHLKSDPLSSFWNDIKQSPCIAGRSSSDYDVYLDDPMVNILDKYRTETRKLNGTFTPSASGANHYVLTIGGME